MEQVVSKEVANREAIARFLKSSIVEHGPQMVEVLGTLLFPDGVPDDVNLTKFVAACGGYVERVNGEMHDADVALAAEKADDPAAVAARDKAVTVTREELIDTRSLLNGTYGRGTSDGFGMKGNTPEQPDLLRNRGETVVKLLRTQPLPEPKAGRSPIDPAGLANAVEAILASMIEAINGVTKEEREYQLALSARDKSVEAWARMYRGMAGLISSLFWLVGLDDLHDRVRPTAKRRAGVPEREDLEES